jgi:hypothetical protein
MEMGLYSRNPVGIIGTIFCLMCNLKGFLKAVTLHAMKALGGEEV